MDQKKVQVFSVNVTNMESSIIEPKNFETVNISVEGQSKIDSFFLYFQTKQIIFNVDHFFLLYFETKRYTEIRNGSVGQNDWRGESSRNCEESGNSDQKIKNERGTKKYRKEVY